MEFGHILRLVAATTCLVTIETAGAMPESATPFWTGTAKHTPIETAVFDTILVTDPASAVAEQPFERLFGVRIGNEVSNYNLIGELVVQKGLWAAPEWIQKISPPDPNPLFKEYSVKYNPATALIYEIDASSLSRYSECTELIMELSSVLKQKYPDMEYHQKENNFSVSQAGSEGIFPLQVACFADRINIMLLDNERLQEHIQENKDRSPISAKGL
ncbi:hypothetical protein [Mesorhizobium amorphae]|uniref:hypothetical protein n=1 Tax=Mesorhizobium amorphae TaxID=71433 RepID=UPI00178235F4|nr:hypothetical protein [Mesorhizobium amorphae]